MKRSYIGLALAASHLLFAAAETSGAADGEAKENKSIVPAKYAGKYKGGGSDALAEFINEQCTGSEGFEFTAFFELCRINGIDETKVDHYKGLYDGKVQGAAGRARMTLRNMLAAKARKEGKLLGLDKKEVNIDIPKPAASGAAKAQKEAKEKAA